MQIATFNFSTLSKRFFISMSVILSMMAFSVSAQSKIVTGKVIDPNGQPAALVTVELVNQGNHTLLGTTTDMNGEFTLEVKNFKSYNLKFSYLGYDNQLTALGTRNFVHVQMLKSGKLFDENNVSEANKIGLNE